VSGNIENKAGSLIRLISYDDQFSLLEKTISSVKVSGDGSFVLEGEINETQIVLVALDLKKSELVVEPGQSYEIKFLEDVSANDVSIYEQNPLQYEILNKSVLNSQIQNFNVRYNAFLIKNFNAIYRSRNNSIIDGFKEEMESVFGDYNDQYFKNYAKYKLASLELAGRKKLENKLIKEYFVNKDILYFNIEYVSLFKEVFNSYLTSGHGGIDFSNLVEIINYSATFKNLDEAISNGNTILSADERIRELIAVVGLVKLFNRPEFNNNNIIKILRQIERNSRFAENVKIASNYISEIQNLSYGSFVDNFELIDQNQKKVVFSNQEGNFILLSFMKENCNICVSQISMLDELRLKFKGKLQNVSLVSGGDISDYLRFMNERNYVWPLVKVENILLLEAYDIKVFPTYILLNPDGSIAMAPTPMPEENLGIYIDGFMKRWNTK
jgi:peroxiredoxin